MKFASAIAFVALTLPAGAQEQNATISLSCNGTSKLMAPAAAHQNPDRIKDISIIVNVANRTVALMDNVVPITSIMANLVNFSGVQPPPVLVPGMKPKPFSVGGTIDRVAGYASIHWWYEDAGNNTSWKLTCSPK